MIIYEINNNNIMLHLRRENLEYNIEITYGMYPHKICGIIIIKNLYHSNSYVDVSFNIQITKYYVLYSLLKMHYHFHYYFTLLHCSKISVKQ